MKNSLLIPLAVCLLFSSAKVAGQCIHSDDKLPPGWIDERGALGPLQATLTLDCLKFEGVTTQGKKTVAFLKDDRGKTYVVKRGDLIGEKMGRLTEIRSKKLTIVQLVPDGRGGWIEQKRYIRRTQ